MSARNPTTFNAWNDESAIQIGSTIKTTVPSAVIDDQMFILDKGELVISDCFIPYGVTAGAYTTINIYYLDTKDMCGVDGVSNDEIEHDVYFLMWASNGTTNGSIRLTSSLASSNTNVVQAITGSTTPTWYKVTPLNIKTNGTEDTLTLEGIRTAGAGTIYLAGLGVIAKET